MAALVLSNRHHEDDRSLAPICWSLAVFFESYMVHGSEWTADEFGPKEPVELKEVCVNGEEGKAELCRAAAWEIGDTQREVSATPKTGTDG